MGDSRGVGSRIFAGTPVDSNRQPSRLRDGVSASKPLGAITIDGLAPNNGGRVLFTNLSGGESGDNNKVFRALVTAGSVTGWNLDTDGRNPNGEARDGDTMYITEGGTYGDKLFKFTGSSWSEIGGGGAGANTSLSNLTATSINEHLIPQASKNLGSSLNPWAETHSTKVFFGSGTAAAPGLAVETDQTTGLNQAGGVGTLSVAVSGSNRFNFNTSAFYPSAHDTYDIGTSAVRVRRMYLQTQLIMRKAASAYGAALEVGDGTTNIGSYLASNTITGGSAYHYMTVNTGTVVAGVGIDGSGFHNSVPGTLLIATITNQDINLMTNSALRWRILAAGAFSPVGDNTYNIGQTSSVVNTLYVRNIEFWVGGGQNVTMTGSSTGLSVTGGNPNRSLAFAGGPASGGTAAGSVTITSGGIFQVGVTVPSGAVTISSGGNTQATVDQATGNTTIATGNNAGSGANAHSGNLILQTGTIVGGTRGTINMVERSLATAAIGYVWTLQDTATGRGAWAAAGGGGFNPNSSPVNFLSGHIQMRNDAADWWTGSNLKIQGNADTMTDTYLVIGISDHTVSGTPKKNLAILTGTQDISGATSGTGQIDIVTGYVWQGSGNSGNFFISTGGINAGVTGNSGQFEIQSGDNSGTGNTGQWTFRTGNASNGISGLLSLATGNGIASSGSITITTGNATTTSGSITLGTGTGATRGTINFNADISSNIIPSVGTLTLGTSGNNARKWQTVYTLRSGGAVFVANSSNAIEDWYLVTQFSSPSGATVGGLYSPAANSHLGIFTAARTLQDSRYIYIETGAYNGTTGGQASGIIQIRTGNATANNGSSGNIVLQTGSITGGTGVQGSIVLIASQVNFSYVTAVNFVIQNGVTANRPATPVIGSEYFDTTLGIPIWYNGTNWVDAAGTTV